MRQQNSLEPPDLIRLKFFIMHSEYELKKCFSSVLQESLVKRYKKLPSSAFVAKEFNLRAVGSTPVTSEAVRRWIKGISLPEFERMVVLRNWLGIDLNLVCLEASMTYGSVAKGLPPLSVTSKKDRFVEIAHEIDESVSLLIRELEKFKKT